MSDHQLNWGILGTGAIARTFARGLAQSRTGRLVAVSSRSRDSADRFAAEFGIDRAHASYDAILADPGVQALYIATPHPFHAQWAIRAARAGKHVLVEKPAALNHAQLMAMIDAADACGVFFMEAFMYRCHPQTARLVELIRDKAIGEVRVIQSTCSFHAGFNPDSRLYNNALGGGGILDVGCYPVSISRLIVGAALGGDFADPIEVRGSAHMGATGVDEWAVASVKFPGGILAQLATGVSLVQDNTLRIFGSDGWITVPNALMGNRTQPDQGRILLQRKGESQPREVLVNADVTSFTYEADIAGLAILAGKRQASSPAMSWHDSLGNLSTLDQWRESAGLTYDSEKPQNYSTLTISGDPLRFASRDITASSGPDRPEHTAASATSRYARINGLDKPISRLVMGCDNQRTFSHAAILFDDFFERGGNAFDTAFIYGGGLPERLLGQWIKHRGVRDQIVLIAKGAHTPFCDPHSLATQLLISLDRLGLDCADIYLMHRDNPQVPVGEFVDVLNEHARAGRMRVFGGSNWTLDRVDQANAYARSHGLQGFSLVSNQFGLARMVQPIWGGSIAASDPASREWFARTQTPLLAWSSQCRGFFVENRAHPDRRDDPELVRAWYCDDNFRRLDRVKQLAGRKGVAPITLALAYVLNQPFPVHALIGPRVISETGSSFQALGLELTQDEINWLNLDA